MIRPVRIFTVAIIFLCSSAWCNLADGWKTAEESGLDEVADLQDERFARRHPVVFSRENIYESHYSAADKSKRGTSFLEGRSLDGPALLASWLGIRQLTCPEANYFVCANNPSRCCPNGDGCCPPGAVSECCPDGQDCCADSEYCVEPNGVCCGTAGTCDAGWNCCEGVACYPNGAECCANGNYCPSGSVCVLYEGAVKCSSTGGATVAPPTTTAPETTAPETTAPETTATTTPVVFTYYYYTITWWYIEWFYVWTIFAEAATTVLTSTTTTLYTTISIYDTNSAAAAASFSSLSQTLSLPTPAVRTNPVPVGTSPAVPGSTHSSIPTSTSNVKTGSEIGQSTTSSEAGIGQTFSLESTTSSTSSSKASTSSSSTSVSVVLSSSANAVGAGGTSFWAIGAFVGMLIAPGFLMIWL